MPGEATERVTYCRVCEPLCGMVATVEDGRLTKLRPDPDNPLSAGFACPKGIAMSDVQNDPDRVLHPLRRTPSGEFEQVSWEVALTEIATRLARIRSRHGGGAVGWYMGNPGAFSYSHPLWAKGFTDALGSPHFYSAASQDVSNRFAASQMLYGSPFQVPIPDLARTDLLLIVGANPLVSHGSVMSAPRVKDLLRAIPARGGRVVVVDPRRSETARAFEHLAITPDTDAWWLFSLLAVIFEEGLEDSEAIGRQALGVDGLRRLVAQHPPRRPRPGPGSPPRPLAPWLVIWPRLPAPPSTGGPAPASAVTAPWSPSCSTRSTWSPATSTARGARCSGTRRSTSRASRTGSGWPPTTRFAHG